MEKDIVILHADCYKTKSGKIVRMMSYNEYRYYRYYAEKRRKAKYAKFGVKFIE